MTEAGGREHTLILRLWCEGDTDGAVWRCSVEDPGSQDRRGFSDVAELLPFLELLTREIPSPRAAREGETSKEARK